MSEERLNIICLSNQMWDFPLYTNKKHVMSRLSALGHNVLFVDPPINAGRMFARQIARGQWNIQRLLTRMYTDEKVTVFTPLNFIPDKQTTSKQHSKKIQQISESMFDPNLRTVLWIYHVEIPYVQNYVETIKHDVLIYDCVDNYTAFPESNTFYSATVGRDVIVEQEKYLTKNAHLVFATAPGLVEKLQSYGGNVFFTPNVGDYQRFSKTAPYKENLPEDLKNIRRPRIGFAGAVDEYKFDKELVKKLAQTYKEYNFVIIGPMALQDREASVDELGFKGLTNIHFLGTKPYEDLVQYYAGFDAYIIPYQLNDYTVGGCFPVKFHDALASGLPTVVTNLPAYAPFSNVSYISKNETDFIENVKKAIEEDSKELILKRQEVAKENDWDGKVQKMLNLVFSLRQ